MINAQVFGAAMVLYLVATVVYVTYVVSGNNKVGAGATVVALVGWLVNTAAIGIRWVESYKAGYGYVPLSNMYESMVFFAWSVMLIYLVFERLYGFRAIGVFASTLGFLGIAVVSFAPNISKDIQPLVPALQSNWLTAHVITCFFGYAAFGVSYAIAIMLLSRSPKRFHVTMLTVHPLFVPAFVTLLWLAYELLEKKDFVSPQTLGYLWAASAGLSAFIFVMYFFFRRAEGVLPPERVLDDLSYKAVAVGFPLLTLGILTGAAWANYAWGTYWSWDPKETWSLITWFVYAAFLHARFTAGWRGTRLAWMSIVGFGAVLFTYWGVNFVLSGLHSYGSG